MLGSMGITLVESVYGYFVEGGKLKKWMINPEVNAGIYKSGLWMPIVKEWDAFKELEPQLAAKYKGAYD